MCQPYIRPVYFQEGDGIYRIVSDVGAMGEALVRHCDPTSASFRAAAHHLLSFLAGAVPADVARIAFIEALSAAKVAVSGVHPATRR